MKRHALGWFAAAALVTVIGAADPAHAKRFHRFDTTDAETKAYCSKNPTHCKRTINWPATIGLTVGPALAFGWLRSIFD